MEIEGPHASVKAEKAVDHLVIFLSSREDISQSRIEPPTPSLRLGIILSYLLNQLELCLGVGCLHRLSIFVKFVVHAWNRCGGLNNKHFKS